MKREYEGMIRRTGSIACVGLVTGVGAVLGGCYERVIDARGIGTDGIAVQKPYRSETALDQAVFPDKPGKDNGFSSSGSSNNFDRSYPETPSTPRTPN